MPRRPSNRHMDLLGDESDSVEEFQSPEQDVNQTNYGLEYTSSQHRINLQPSTSRNAQNSLKKQPTARKKTGGALRVARQGTPSTTSAIAPNQETLPKGSRRRKMRKPMYRNMGVLKEIRKLQRSTHILIPRLPFARLVKEILMGLKSEVDRVTKVAMEALHESTEVYVTYQLQDAYTLTLHRGRVTLSVKDMELLRFLRGRT